MQELPGSRNAEGQSMSASWTVLEIICELASKINEEARGDPQSPYANKFVGIASEYDLARITRQANG
jgi:hypothetical protein